MSKNRYRVFKKRTKNGIYFVEDNETGKQSSLRTSEKSEAIRLLNAMNEAHRQPYLNLEIARSYLMAADPTLVTRTWQDVMTEGTTVTGRLVKDGKPLKAVGVGWVSVDRSENFTGNFDVATDENGFFRFQSIPPYQQYFVYGLMDSLKNIGCVPAKRLRVSADGSRKDMGNLEVVAGLRLTGRVVLSDGAPIVLRGMIIRTLSTQLRFLVNLLGTFGIW